jgi:hypothetical protein
MEFRCPDCASPEGEANPQESADAYRCANCGARFHRDSALVTLVTAEAEMQRPAFNPELFRLDRARTLASINDPDGALWPVNAYSDADELNGLVQAALEAGVIAREDSRACLYIYPLALSEPDPVLAVDSGTGPTLLGYSLKLREREGESPVEFTVRLLGDMVDEANALLSHRDADSARLDRIAAYMSRPGPWNGGDVCEVVAIELRESGRELLDNAD